MIRASRTDLSFVAGFLEGDGSISAKINPQADHRHGYRVRVVVSFAQSLRSRKLLEYIHSILGGYGTLQDYPYHEKGMCELVIRTKSQVREIVTLLFPYLLLKKRQATLALQILDLLPERKQVSREKFLKAVRLAEEMRNLNFCTGLKGKYAYAEIKEYLFNQPRND